MLINIEYKSRGGQCPYQAEGKINQYYFYFRERHGYCTLELAESEEQIMFDNIANIGYKINGISDNREANRIIRKLFTQVKKIIK